MVLTRVERSLGVRLDRAAAVRKRRSIGLPSDAGTWVRVEARPASKVTGQGWNGIETASALCDVAAPRWHQSVSWADSGGDIELSSRMMIAARAEGWTGWAWEAFESLVYFPINVDADGYVNGRHRASAMMAAGVRKTVVQVLVPDG